MKYISKGREPEVLKKFKKDDGTKYINGGLKITEIQQQLLAEQKGLCAYCMDRIYAELGKNTNMIVEHVKCRTNHSALQLDYNNMLGVCFGGEKNPMMEPHCDKSKDTPKGYHYELIKLNPLNHNVESLIRFLETGTIIAVNGDVDVESDIIGLNLNEEITRINRENILKRLKEDYKNVCRTNNKALVRRFLEENINKWSKLNNKGYLQPYNLVALKFLNNKRAKLG